VSRLGLASVREKIKDDDALKLLKENFGTGSFFATPPSTTLQDLSPPLALKRIMTHVADFTVDPRLIRAIMSGQVRSPGLLFASNFCVFLVVMHVTVCRVYWLWIQQRYLNRA
jgi:hypothetical protein